MSTPIGFRGAARMSPLGAAVVALTFAANASATKTAGLDPSKSYDLFFDVAGASDITVSTTSDSPDAIAKGRAVYGAAKTYSTLSAAGYAGNVAAGTTGIKVTHAKNGSGTDDAPTVAALGGRFQCRVVPKIASQTVDAAAADQGLYGDYTAIT